MEKIKGYFSCENYLKKLLENKLKDTYSLEGKLCPT